MSEREPRASRPHIPDYGIPTDAKGMLTWEEVARAFGTSPRYWIATTNPDGSPHVIQQWGAFLDAVLYFEGGPQTRWSRNLARDPRAVATAEHDGLAMMLEGRVRKLTPPVALGRRIIAAYRAKPYGYVPQPANWKGDALVAVDPVKVLAWRFDAFNTTATRFTFAER